MNDTRPGYHDMQRQVDRKIGFFMHLAVYLVINSALVLLNFLHNPGRPSAMGAWSASGGVLFHGLAVFLNAPERMETANDRTRTR